ncbi:MAG: PASTA domain-containing protein [Candidatus Eremiobacteraeota bacterium]|nr:PASTA domain-containing protein [Candidatus Eremiobacteraeota bacterium]MBV9737585.1 PASTA domain-containing protein [Candidatus Eremiobacteraeota bacterium]
MIAHSGDRPRRTRAAWRSYLPPRDWMFTLAVAIFVGIVVWFGRSVHDFFVPTTATLAVPTFVGQTLGDATSEAYHAGLHTQVVARQISDRYPRDTVMDQQPPPGARVREGRQISFIVSTGVQISSMPDMRYQSLREAGLDLSRLHLQLSATKYVQSDEVPPNHIVDQDPPPLSNVREGTAVTLTVSKGGTAQTVVPNFVGETIDMARDDAARSKIHLGQLVWMPLGPSAPPHGTIVRQTPNAGSKIDAFTPVSLEVSAGPNESGYVLRQVHLLASVPADQSADTPLRVRLTVTDATGKWNLYDAFAQPGQKLDFNVSTLGTSLVDFFVNDALVAETRLGAEPPNAYQHRASPGPRATPAR